MIIRPWCNSTQSHYQQACKCSAVNATAKLPCVCVSPLWAMSMTAEGMDWFMQWQFIWHCVIRGSGLQNMPLPCNLHQTLYMAVSCYNTTSVINSVWPMQQCHHYCHQKQCRKQTTIMELTITENYHKKIFKQYKAQAATAEILVTQLRWHQLDEKLVRFVP